MEEQMSSLAVTHLLQHTLRSLCTNNNIHNSQWVYAVFWRILPRNYPPPKWDTHQGGAYDRSRGNRRNWILVWEDGFCNFGASSSSPHHHHEMNNNNNINGEEGEEDHHHHHHHQCPTNSLVYDYNNNNNNQGLQPELFFKMSHEIYNYGEGLIGKVAADHSHKWIYKEPNHNNNNTNTNQEINFLSAWHNSPDSHPRTWEAQFQSGIKTIALIAVREGVIQLGAVQKVIEDLSYVVLLRKKFSYIESIPGVLLPHPSSTPPAPPYPFIKIDTVGGGGSAVGSYSDGAGASGGSIDGWQYFHHHYNNLITPPQLHIPPPPHTEFYDHYNINQQHHPMKIAPSMSSLEALLSKLPSVVVPPPAASTSSPPPVSILPGVAYHVEGHDDEQQHYVTSSSTRSMDVDKEKEEDQEDEDQRKKKMKKMKKNKKNVVGSDCHDNDQNSSSVSSYHPNNQHFGNYHHHHHQDLNHVSHGY